MLNRELVIHINIFVSAFERNYFNSAPYDQYRLYRALQTYREVNLFVPLLIDEGYGPKPIQSQTVN